MEENPQTILPPDLESPEQRREWWEQLPVAWQNAFATGYLDKPERALPSDNELVQLARSPVLRLVGHGGMHPNHDQPLGSTRSIGVLTNLQYLFLPFSEMDDIEGIERLTGLKSLFIHNNRITNLDPVASLSQLEELYCQDNQITSIFPIQHCPKLHTVYCQYNALQNLRGLTRMHARTIQRFVCLPNNAITPKEIRRVENKLGILCTKE